MMVQCVSEDVSLVKKDNIDIETAIDMAGQGRYNLYLLFTCCMVMIGGVMDMLGYSLVVPAASCDLKLTLEQGGILKSISFAGFLLALPWGYIADTTGRKRTILMSVTVGFIFSAMTSFSTSFSTILVLKLLASCFSTASLTLATTYLGESTSRSKRNRYIFILNISSTGTDFLCFVLAYLILPLNFVVPVPYLNTYKSWRLLSLVMSLPLGLSAVMLCFLKESPKFLANKGDTDKAMDVLRAMFKANFGRNSVYPVNSLIKTVNIIETSSFWNNIVLKQITPIFKPPLLWRSLQLFLLLSICCSTNNAFFMWFPTMVDSFFTSADENRNFCQKVVANITPHNYNDVCIENSSINTIYAGMVLTLVATVLNIGAITLANWRRTLIFTSFLVAGFSCVTVNLFYEPTISLVLFCIIQFTLIAIGSVNSFYVDIFPTSYRGLAISLGMMVARTVSLAGVAIVGTTIINYCQFTFYCWTAFLLSGIVAAVFLPKSETRRTNEETN